VRIPSTKIRTVATQAATPAEPLTFDAPATHLRALGLGLRHHRAAHAGESSGLAAAASVINAFELRERPLTKSYRRDDWGMFIRYATPESTRRDDRPLDLMSFGRLLSAAGARTRTVEHPSVASAREAIEAASQDPGQRVVVAFSDGRFSPVLGYDPARDRVLLQSSVAGRPSPRWSPLATMFQDPKTEGYVHARRPPRSDVVPSYSPSSTSTQTVSLESERGIELLQSAKMKSMTRFAGLIAYHEVQETLSFCGLASLTMAANDLGLGAAPLSQAQILAGLTPERADAVIDGGASLDELAAIAENLGASVTVRHANETLSIDALRADLISALEDPDRHPIASYDRCTLGQEGGGHFSPIAAYNAEADMFLIYDVAPWKSAPFWVQTKDLHRAMAAKDCEQCRGVLIVGRTDGVDGQTSAPHSS